MTNKKKNKMTIRGKTKSVSSSISRAAKIGMILIMLIISMKSYLFGIASAQDLNPPTTGRTSPNLTSTFGPNTPGTAGSGNDTQ
ncbi:MAG TPA: hypothetical protein VE223_08225, partial [Nitrososphaeraceae archaeon]|nr:hypothetical protein [Nitrososphaeraceae archaeon]